jgi:hypothetical protein
MLLNVVLRCLGFEFLILIHVHGTMWMAVTLPCAPTRSASKGRKLPVHSLHRPGKWMVLYTRQVGKGSRHSCIAVLQSQPTSAQPSLHGVGSGVIPAPTSSSPN